MQSKKIRIADLKNYKFLSKRNMKKLFYLNTIFNVSLIYAESPGSFRGKETHGFGFGIEGTGLAGSLFYDYEINSYANSCYCIFRRNQ
ncbi:MAG: hypothetical protein Ct9H300mP4_12300 [Gammaproteobacteria bacterium]|nr:MAG: hypothetical protein Ct9H300mP4_12300 [Gammaproteobacteria bacterium]